MDYVTCMVLYNNKNRIVTKFRGKNYNGILVYIHYNPEIYLNKIYLNILLRIMSTVCHLWSNSNIIFCHYQWDSKVVTTFEEI